MACFIVPMTLAIGIGAIRKKISTAYHINWLIALLGGGAAAVAVEHLAQGEIVLYPPFLTALSSPAEATIMLREMATIGSTMAIVCVAIWAVIVAYASRMERNKSKTTA